MVDSSGGNRSSGHRVRGTLHSAEAVLGKHFGYPGFRPGQAELVLAALAGRDSLGILPTGGGKTVCYQVPALILPGLTLVISPLISLMSDQVDRAKAVGLRAAALTSVLSSDQRRQLMTLARRGGLDLLLVSPERLLLPGFQRLLNRAEVSLVAVDEAHCISAWGHDFRPAYRKFGPLCRAIGRPIMALTATATPEVRRDITRVLGLSDPVVTVQSFDRPNLVWSVEPASGHGAKLAALWRHLGRDCQPAIVYAGTRRTVEAVRRALAARGLPIRAYHAGLAAEERSRVQAAFMSGESRIIVATNAFGMGIDKADVRRVLHYQLSGTLEGYYQEAGRAGRDGQPAQCVALHGLEDLRLHRRFVDRSRPRPGTLLRTWRTLQRGARGSSHGLTATELAALQWGSSGPEDIEAALTVLQAEGCVTSHQNDDGGPESWAPLADPPRLELARLRKLRKAALAKIEAVRRYATTRSCRRREILSYFGEDHDRRPCGRCDRCVRID